MISIISNKKMFNNFTKLSVRLLYIYLLHKILKQSTNVYFFHFIKQRSGQNKFIFQSQKQGMYHYNQKYMEVSKPQVIQKNQSSHAQMSLLSEQLSYGTVYNIELTTSQANALTRLLPSNYSIHLDRSIKTKRIVKRKSTNQHKSYKSILQPSEEIQINYPSEQRYIQPKISAPILTITYDEMLQKCNKMLNLLYKNKNSWPFREPVDPITMCIPQYVNVITNPMDLRTIGQNLNYHKYSTMSQFYADIHLVIGNSYTFNKNNQQFYALTAQFQKYFDKIKIQSIYVTKIQNPALKKVLSKSINNQPVKQNYLKSGSDLTVRKQLAQKLKYLPKEQLTTLIRMISDGQKNNQINLQTLTVDKIRKLQDYLQNKIHAKVVKNSQCEQSSFRESDSD